MIVGARASDDCKRHWLCRRPLGCWRNALCGFAWASALAFCRQAAWRQGAVVRLRRGGLVEALELAQLKVVGPIAYSNYVSGVIDGQKFFSGWNGDRGPLAMTRPVVCF